MKNLGKKTIYLISVLALMFCVSAAILEYYGQVTTNIEVKQTVEVSGDTDYPVDGYSGETIFGEEISAVNVAPFDVNVRITNDAPEGITVTYLSELQLSQKVVEFGSEPWVLLEEGDTALVEYVVSGDEFSAEVIDGAKEGYTLIYYKDNSDRFNSPAKAILLSSVIGDLPYEDDKNADEYDYCLTGEYLTCNGAKLWYVPEDAVLSENELDWSRAEEFLFETELIEYSSDGKATIYKDNTISFKPQFDLEYNFAGNVTVATNVEPSE